MKMDEVALMVSDIDDGLRERLDEEIYAFNVAATGHADGRLLGIAVRGDGGDLRGVCRGGRGADVATSSFCGYGRVIAGLARAPACWSRRSRKCSAVAATRWP
jgi:hypothetical protein